MSCCKYEAMEMTSNSMPKNYCHRHTILLPTYMKLLFTELYAYTSGIRDHENLQFPYKKPASQCLHGTLEVMHTGYPLY